ncbi:MAG: YbaB/EbfC family nucleoid-associated protein [Bdellovibrionales bacterium]|nr:YbaB/EbfC family nucleoid-associated protein [Bdellovibrionales bacterium]
MSKGFKGFPGNMQGLMKQAQQMQQQLKATQDNAVNLTAEGSAGGGMVKAVMNGKHKLVSISLEKDVVDPNNLDIDMIQDLIIAAVNEASEKVQDAVQAEIEKVTGGLSLPGFI